MANNDKSYIYIQYNTNSITTNAHTVTYWSTPLSIQTQAEQAGISQGDFQQLMKEWRESQFFKKTQGVFLDPPVQTMKHMWKPRS